MSRSRAALPSGVPCSCSCTSSSVLICGTPGKRARTTVFIWISAALEGEENGRHQHYLSPAPDLLPRPAQWPPERKTGGTMSERRRSDETAGRFAASSQPMLSTAQSSPTTTNAPTLVALGTLDAGPGGRGNRGATGRALPPRTLIRPSRICSRSVCPSAAP